MMLLEPSSKTNKSFSLESVAAARSFGRSAFLRTLTPLFVVVFLFWISPARSRAQSIQYTENKPDQALRSAMRVDPSTLGLSIEVPIAAYPGRGGTSVPITLFYSSKQWRLDYFDSFLSGTGELRTESFAKFSEWAKAGWTTGADVPIIEWTGHTQVYNGNGNAPCDACSGSGDYYINRIHVHMPGGATHELRINDTPTTLTYAGTYYAVDGSNLRYEASSFSDGVLYLPDGSRYLLNGADALYIDRNGNTLTYNAINRQWTDTQNRVLDVPLPASPSPTPYTYYLPSTTSTPVSYSLRWSTLANALTNPGDDLHYKTNMTFGIGETWNPRAPALFEGDGANRLYDGPGYGAAGKFDPIVLAEIILPNGQNYLFTYNVYGEITKVVYPTGAYERFNHAAVAGVSFLKAPYPQSNRGVVDRWLSATGNSSDEVHWHYAASKTNNVLTVSTIAPDDPLTTAKEDTLTERLMSAETSEQFEAFGFSNVELGMPFEERVCEPSQADVCAPSAGGGAMLRRTLTSWTSSGPTPGGWNTATRNPRVTKNVSILLDTGTSNALTSTTTMSYDDDLNVIATNNYDFTSISQSSAQTLAIGSIDAGSLLRTVEATYLVNDTTLNATTRAAYRNRNLLSLPTSTRVKNSSNVVVAKTRTSYDDYDETGTNQQGIYPLLTYVGTITHWTDPATSLRGLPTTTGVWLNTTDSYLESHAQYDQFGNVRKIWDANGNQSLTTYDGYSYAYPTTATTAVPDGTGYHGSPTAFSTTAEYNDNTGLMTLLIDANGQATSYTYDAINRPAIITRPTGGGSTTYEYGDTPGDLYVRTQTSLDSTRVVEAYQYYDKLGRPSRTFLNEGSTYATTDTQYDSLGRPWRRSNPYRTTSLTAAVNPDNNWTTNGYDYLGRVTSVTTSDGAVVTTDYRGSTSTPLGTVATVTDQSEKLRRRLTDALGQLVRVDEADTTSPTGSLGTVASPHQPTSYSYDLLGNLLEVTQGSQSRTFVYDSLSRLRSAMNPESGTINYTYDNNGNLLTKTDARLVVSTYEYDALNRNKGIVYTNDPAGTPAVNRYYDGWRGQAFTNIPMVKGRLWQSETSGANGSRTTINSYDALGRPLSESQQFYAGGQWSQAYTVQRTPYTLAGGVTSQIYPSGHSVTYNYDQAGRLGDKDSQNLAFTGTLGDGVTRTYSRGITYSVFGLNAQEQFGTDAAIYNKQAYNSRGQLVEIKVSTVPNDSSWNRGKLINWYSLQCGTAASPECNAADNNGNLRKQETLIPNDEQNTSSTSWYQQYEYDSLNRLAEVHEHANSSLLWRQTFTYDRWGNRTIDQNATSPGINRQSFEVETATNRLLAPGDSILTGPNLPQRKMRYDAAGNLTNDSWSSYGSSTAGQITRTYDAENRMTSAQDSSGGVSYYNYNADGQRVRRKIGVVETWHVYGMGGELLAEYDANGGASSPQKEYGYRNGQLLITATVTSGWGSAPTLHDNPLVVNETTIQARHITELRDAINAVRTNRGMLPYSWQYSATTNDWISANPILEMRTALDQALGAPSGGYSPGLAQYQQIKAVHIQELRDRVLAAWTSGSSTQINWLVGDQLGTPRMVFDQTGSVTGMTRHDYLPFGEELMGGQNGRTVSQGYVSNNVRQKFTSKERDIETGLDYFGARYFSSTQGRFTSSDPLLASGAVHSPQTWNRHSYALNNPFHYVDPDGQYNEDVHYRLTRLIAMAVGFPGGLAKRIAFATQDVDDNPRTSPLPSRHGAGVDRRRKWHFTTEARRKELWNQFLESGSPEDLGTYLHAMQDSYSHRGLGPVVGQVNSPAFWKWKDADDTWRDAEKADDMAEDTYNHLDWGAEVMEDKGTLTGRIKPMSWGQISDLVHNINAASGEGQKRYFLMLLEARVNEWWRQQLKEQEREQQKRRWGEKGQY